MKTAVVIPTLGRTFFSYNLVMALVGGTRKPDEIIVVDRTSTLKVETHVRSRVCATSSVRGTARSSGIPSRSHRRSECRVTAQHR